MEAPVIDEINILQAAMLAMDKAVEKLPTPPDYVLVDGNRLPKVRLPPPGRLSFSFRTLPEPFFSA